MQNDIDLIKKQFKDNIQQLIDNNNLNEAKELIDQYKNIAKDDIDAYSMDAVVLIMEGKFQKVEKVLKEGLDLDENNFDLNYNLAYVYQQIEKLNLALEYYEKAKISCKDEKLKEQINSTINEIENKHPEAVNDSRLKLVFFVKQGMDSFLGDIIKGLSDDYITKKIVVTEYKQIDEGMKWADICWFEWCDELVIYGSKLAVAKEKKVVCRLHSYEAFTDYPSKVDWDKVDKLIFIAEHIKKFVSDKIKIHNRKLLVISNGIDINKWRLAVRKHGFNIAYVGYVNYKKGPMLLLHTFKAIYDKDSRYKLYIAGQFQDDRDVLYFQQMIKEFGIEKNVIYEGWQNNLDEWLKNKNYILCTSILESQNMSVMQAMAKGMKPIIHNFVGAKQIYPKECIWNTIDEAVDMIQSSEYCSENYRKFIEDNYSLESQIDSIKSILSEFKKNMNVNIAVETKLPLVSVCIPVYNGEKYIKYTIDSVLNQTYKNLEIIICDNCSTDNTIKIVNSYYDRRIRLFKNSTNIGLYNNAKKCIKLSNGKYIKYVFADDTIDRNCIQEMVKVMESNLDVTLAGVNYCYIDEKNNIINEHILNMGSGKYFNNEFFKQLIIKGNIVGCPSGVIIRKGVLASLNNIFDIKLSYMPDYDLWIKLCKLGNYYFINKNYMNFRIQKQSITGQKISKIIRVKEFYYLLNKYINNSDFTDDEIKEAYKNANNRSYYSLNINNNLNEKLEIINYILDNSKYIPEDEKDSLLRLKIDIEKILN